ncbi:hypothetical protein E8E14_003256 [Neopestalotiopsis sp. 37M]|nr:hypothetical protein E8E14_003256 [Neopestalotiopsis sp. 37M]
MVKLNPLDYTIALFAVLGIEAQAALHMLDHRHDGEFSLERGDDYVFYAGDINGRNVIVATFPAGENYGKGSAAALASQTKSFFRNLWFGLLIGVAAGLPNHTKSPPVDIRLGDVLVALPKGNSAGLISYDLGKETEKGFELLDGGRVLAKTERVISSAISNIQNDTPSRRMRFLEFYEAIRDEEHDFECSMDQTFRDPGQDEDKLYTIGTDGIDREVPRIKRPDGKRTRVWYGPIGSGDTLWKNARKRDGMRDDYGIIGLEMEAAGMLSSLPVGVIRGVCDYGDSHKNKQWQPYAAAMAASYAKAILMKVGQGEETPLAADKPEANVGCEILCDLPSQTDRFFGREAELRSMKQLLQGTDGRRGAVLCGISGSGKTQLAREYVSREQDKLSAIVWINAASSQTVDQSFAQCAERILLRSQHMAQNLSRVSNQTLVLEWLRKSKLRNWLIVIDGVDNLIAARNLVQSLDHLLSRHGAICITSTNPKTTRTFGLAQISVEHLDMSSARSLILWRALEKTTPHDQNVENWTRDAARILNRYALGLELAGILIHEGIVRFDMPPTIFETHYKQLTTIDPQIWNWGKPHTLFDIFDTLYTDLISKSRVAGDLLTLCSIYGPQEISITFLQKLVFEETESSTTSQEPWRRLQGLFEDEICLGVAITKLHEVFLAHKKCGIDRSVQSFSLHGSICQWRFAAIDDQRAQWIIPALQALALYLHFETEHQRKGKSVQSKASDVFRKYHVMTSRCLKMLQGYVSPEQLEAPDGLFAKQYYNICIRLAPLITEIGDHALASSLFAGAIKYLKITCTDDLDEALFPLLCGLGECFKKTGNMTRSEECLRSADELAVNLYGKDSDETLCLRIELKNVKDHIDREKDHLNRALVGSTGPLREKRTSPRNHPEDADTLDEQEHAMAHNMPYTTSEASAEEPEYDVLSSVDDLYHMSRVGAASAEEQEFDDLSSVDDLYHMSRVGAASAEEQEFDDLSSVDDLYCMSRVGKALDAGIDPNAKNDGATELHAASEKGYINTSTLLLNRGADPDLTDNNGRTPLHLASLHGSTYIVKLLLEKCANVENADLSGYTPLHIASLYGRHHIARVLLGGMANPYAKTNDGSTPLSLAADQDNTRLIWLLLEHIADNRLASSEPDPVIRKAIDRRFLEIAWLYIRKKPDPSNEDGYKDGLLQTALANSDIERVKLLLADGADVNGAYERRRTPLHYAAALCDFDMVNLLLERGANLNATDRIGGTPLHYAAEFAEADIVRLLCTKEAGQSTENDERQTAFNSAENRPPDYVATSQSAPIITLATENSSINTTDRNGDTPLWRAVSYGGLGAVHALLSHHADITSYDFLGDTYLHMACRRGDLEIVKALLDHGADKTILNNRRQSALQIAQYHGHDSIVGLLRSRANRPNATSTRARIVPVKMKAWLQRRRDRPPI